MWGWVVEGDRLGGGEEEEGYREEKVVGAGMWKERG